MTSNSSIHQNDLGVKVQCKLYLTYVLQLITPTSISCFDRGCSYLATASLYGVFITKNVSDHKWASTRQNLSSGLVKRRDSNQSPQLQRQDGKLKFRL